MPKKMNIQQTFSFRNQKFTSCLRSSRFERLPIDEASSKSSVCKAEQDANQISSYESLSLGDNFNVSVFRNSSNLIEKEKNSVYFYFSNVIVIAKHG
jgi:hypothetical protein